MISFKYHLVSVIGIFLAIALGVVVGTTAVNGAVVGDLRRQVSDLKSTRASDASKIISLQGSAGTTDTLVQAYGRTISGNALVNTSVVLVGAPGATASLLSGVSSAITSAGGKVSGQVQLTSAFTDPSRANDLKQLTLSLHPLGLYLPTTTDAGTLAGALLGFVLQGKATPTDVTQVLSGLTTLGMATATAATLPGKAIVLIAPGTRPVGDLGVKLLASMSTEIPIISGAPLVVLGDSASASGGGLLAVLRGDPTSKAGVSTVDDGDTALGQLTAALTTAQAIGGHKGHYGTAPGADALMPGAGA